MKHQRTPIIIEDSSDDESLSQGPLRKRLKRDPREALTLESLIRAGDLLKQEDSKSSEDSKPVMPGRVTPTKDLQDKPPQDLKLVQTALSDTLAALGQKPIGIPPKALDDWKKLCRPLPAPPRLPNVPCGLSVNEKKVRAA